MKEKARPYPYSWAKGFTTPAPSIETKGAPLLLRDEDRAFNLDRILEIHEMV